MGDTWETSRWERIKNYFTKEEEMNRGFATLTDRDLDRAAILAGVLEQVTVKGLANLSPLNEYFIRLGRDASTGPRMNGDILDLVDLIQADLFAVRRGHKPRTQEGTPSKKKATEEAKAKKK